MTGARAACGDRHRSASPADADTPLTATQTHNPSQTPRVISMCIMDPNKHVPDRVNGVLSEMCMW